MSPGRRARAAAIVVVAGISLAGGMVPRASAHAQVKSSVPADGALLQEPPAEVTITFTEPPDPQLSTIDVLSSNGKSVATGKAEPVPGDARTMRVGVQDLPRGAYTIAWRTVSKVDGHVTGGSLSFGVGVAPPKSGSTTRRTLQETSKPTPLSTSGRWALYAGLVVLFAASPMGIAFGGGRARGLWIAWCVAAAGLVLMFVAEGRAVGVSLGTLASSATGRQLVYQGIGLGVAGVGVALYRVRRTSLALALVTAAAAVTMVLHAQAGHAGAAASYTWLRVGLQSVHIAAVGLWIGGLVWLLASLRSLEDAARTAAVTRFSTIAGLALAIVVATGVAREIDEIGGFGNLGALFDTSFGITLLIKTGLVVVLIALAARNRFVNVPSYGRDERRARSLARTVAAEVVVAALVLGASGVLSQLPPPADLRQTVARAPSSLNVHGSDFGTTVKTDLTITPGTVGPNRFRLQIADFDTGAPVSATRVALRFSLADHPEVDSTLELKEESRGTWSASGTQLSLNGDWTVTALIQTNTGSVTVDHAVTPRRPPEDVQVSRAAGQPTLYTIQLGGGSTLQAYVDPGKAGIDNVHYTFFDASGDELPVTDASASATSPDGAIRGLRLKRFTPAHFVANVRLKAGRWVFDISGTTDSGPFSAYFAQTIAP